MASQSTTKTVGIGNPAELKARGPNRTTKTVGKLKVLPEQPELPTSSRQQQTDQSAPSKGFEKDYDDGDSGDDEADGEDTEEPEVEVYNQLDLIPAGTARRDALRLTKKRTKELPRVTAYATASAYRFPELMNFFHARQESYHTNPRIIDAVIYTPYAYEPSVQSSEGVRSSVKLQTSSPPTGDLLGLTEFALDPINSVPENASSRRRRKTDIFAESRPTEAEIFIFDYGTVVIWGMTEAEEKRFLSTLKRFEIDRLDSMNIEMEDLNYYYANYSRIYNDVIALRKGSSYMTKLSLSHAISQSVKISLFESLISNTIEETKDIPEIISETGKIGMPHNEIMRQIGELFLLRTNINSVGSVLDSPEVFWTYPDLQPLYDAARSYLEIPQRINLLNNRVAVLQDMLQLLKETVSSRHAERLEQIVIALIVVEISSVHLPYMSIYSHRPTVLGITTIVVDLFVY